MVGFPGETEEDFEYLLNWLTEAQLDRVGCFTYSAIEGAAANDLPDHVDEAIKEERKDRLMQHQQAISEAKLQAKVGQVLNVLIDEIDEEEGVAIARSYLSAPEIDANVFVDSLPEGVKVGDMIQVMIDEAGEYDQFGQAVS